MRTKQKSGPRSVVKFAAWVVACAFSGIGLYAETTVTFELLGDLPGGSVGSYAYGVSADGSVVVGGSDSSSGVEAFRWENGTMAGLGDLPGGIFASLATEVSADGSVLAGRGRSSSDKEAFRWEGGIMTGLGDLPGGIFNSKPIAVTADGSVVYGIGYSSNGSGNFRWEDGTMTELDLGMMIYDVSADGSVVVGVSDSSSGPEAVRWENGTMTGLGDLPGGDFVSAASGVSADGSVVVGESASANEGEAVFWSEANGWQPVSLNDFLDSEGIDRNGYVLSVATAISSDGTTIVGEGQHTNGNWEAFRVRIVETPEPVQGYEIVGWGQNSEGQATPPPGNDYVVIAAGYYHNLALKSDGSIVGWGNNSGGSASPPAGNDYVALAAGHGQSLALKADGSIVGWGTLSIPPAGNDFIAIASSQSNFSLALKSDGSIVGWADAPTPIPAGNDFTAIAAGSSHSLALKNDGSIVGWGWDIYGQASPPAGNDFVAIAACDVHSLALKSDGSIVGWGSNEDGRASPPSGNDYIAISAGGGHNLALKTDGSVVGWGLNGYGQASPPAGNDFVAIAACGEHSLALKSAPVPILEILQPPQSYTAEPGSSATFTVLTGGIEGEAFGWKHGDTVVGGNSSTLTLSDVQASDAGQYTVTVTAGEESVSSRAVTLGVKAPPYAEKMMNISTRGQILTGTKVMIAGFVLAGSGQKDVLIRGIGPKLGDFGINGFCTDPILTLFRITDPATPHIALNDDWGTLTEDIPSITQRVGGFPLPDGSKDAVLFMNLDTGAYTARVSGLDSTGVGLVELYDADLDPPASTCNLANISTRGEVGIQAQVLIAGFVVAGEVPKQVLVRGIGPRLADFQVDGTLVDPYLRIVKNVDSDQLWVASNDNWSDNPNAADIVSTSASVGAFDLTDGSKDAVMLTWLEPGVYTAQVSGVGETTGVALVEVYEVK